MGAGVKLPVIGGGFLILIDFRGLSFCGPCGPYLFFTNIKKCSTLPPRKIIERIRRKNPMMILPVLLLP